MKFLSQSLRYFLLHSQVFVSLCAGMLAVESTLAAGRQTDFLVPLTVFFSTLFVYNVSRLTLSLTHHGAEKMLDLKIKGRPLHISLAVISFFLVLVLFTGMPWQKNLILLGTGMLSMAYMMPFSLNGRRLKGLRNRVYLKNALLSLVWSLSTVCLPLIPGPYPQSLPPELVFLFLRQFCFIFALAVVYDIRDVRPDALAGMPTVPLLYGDRGARRTAMWSLLAFVFLLLADPFASPAHVPFIKIALLFSAACAAAIILYTRRGLKPIYYTYVVDGVMLLRPLLVILLALN